MRARVHVSALTDVERNLLSFDVVIDVRHADRVHRHDAHPEDDRRHDQDQVRPPIRLPLPLPRARPPAPAPARHPTGQTELRRRTTSGRDRRRPGMHPVALPSGSVNEMRQDENEAGQDAAGAT